jgi:uncharacterized tellurite resistance protein B-like protein
MDAERWHRLEELFHSAVALPAAKRAGFVRRVSTDDPELAAELSGLLGATRVSDGFVEEVMRRAMGRQRQ